LNSENIFTTELRKILTYKEELLTDVKNMLGEEKEQPQKELEDLKGAAQKLVDMMDPQEGGEADRRSLLERLLGVPQKVLSFLTEAPIACVSHALSFVKSFWPEARLEAFT
jgi:hypothetical protein